MPSMVDMGAPVLASARGLVQEVGYCGRPERRQALAQSSNELVEDAILANIIFVYFASFHSPW